MNSLHHAAGDLKVTLQQDQVDQLRKSYDVYQYLAKHVGKQPHQYQEVWLVSGDPFDITGSRNARLNAAWVDRSGLSWRDGLIKDGVPTVSSRRLGELMIRIEEHVNENGCEAT